MKPQDPAMERRPHPYIPNSVPAVKAAMLADVGASGPEDLFREIPEALRFREPLDIPGALDSEADLRLHVERLLARNTSCAEAVSFLGAGCYDHYVPAVCEEVARRSEFLTAYAGEPYEDFGRFQALWEYQSLMAELLDMDVCNVPTYDGHQAACTAIRMAARYTGRTRVLVSGSASPDRLRAIRNYCEPVLEIRVLPLDPETGLLDAAALEAALDPAVAALYLEQPSFLGTLETDPEGIAARVHARGAQVVAGTDPSALGVLAPPSAFGADIACGDIQCLGNPMSFGGGLGGFIATRDEERLVMEYPSRLFGITATGVDGERAFGDVAYERTSFAHREKGKEFVGTASALHGITAAVYLSLMGPEGMRELGIHLLQKARYLARRLSAIPGVKAPAFAAPHFKELAVDFGGTGLTVAAINRRLLEGGVFGGLDLSGIRPEWDRKALWCVTEQIGKDDIDRSCSLLERIVREGR
jgi:glycine dehydrogenase subunit 1